VLPEEILSLASMAGRTVVAAAVTDGWDTAKQGFARLLGRGDAARTEAAEGRLEATRAELVALTAAEVEPGRSRLAVAWQTRLLDLLEEHPETSAALQALLERIQAQLPDRTVSAAEDGLAAGRDITITASHGGGGSGNDPRECDTRKPYESGSGVSLAAPGAPRITAPNSVIVNQGGMAVGLQYRRQVVPSQPMRLMPRPAFVVGRESVPDTPSRHPQPKQTNGLSGSVLAACASAAAGRAPAASARW
jgi:hypothetical protein